MASDQFGVWQATKVHYPGVNIWPPQEEGHAYAGLLVVPGYDLVSGCFFETDWEIWHQATGTFLLELHAPWLRVLEIATELAKSANWTDIDIEGAEVQSMLTAFTERYPDELWIIEPVDDLGDDVDLETIVPYRQ